VVVAVEAVEAVLLLPEAVPATADIVAGFRLGVKGGTMEGRHALPMGGLQATPIGP
jgi:hypothetical protein